MINQVLVSKQRKMVSREKERQRRRRTGGWEGKWRRRRRKRRRRRRDTDIDRRNRLPDNLPVPQGQVVFPKVGICEISLYHYMNSFYLNEFFF